MVATTIDLAHFPSAHTTTGQVEIINVTCIAGFSATVAKVLWGDPAVSHNLTL